MTPFVEQNTPQKNSIGKVSFSDALKNGVRTWGGGTVETFSDLMSSIQSFVSSDQGLGQVSSQEKRGLNDGDNQDRLVTQPQRTEESANKVTKDCYKEDTQKQCRTDVSVAHEPAAEKNKMAGGEEREKKYLVEDGDDSAKEENANQSVVTDAAAPGVVVQQNSQCESVATLSLSLGSCDEKARIKAESGITGENIGEKAEEENVARQMKKEDNCFNSDGNLLQDVGNEVDANLIREGKKINKESSFLDQGANEAQNREFHANENKQYNLVEPEAANVGAVDDEAQELVKISKQENTTLQDLQFLDTGGQPEDLGGLVERVQKAAVSAKSDLQGVNNAAGLTKSISGMAATATANSGNQQQLIGAIASIRPSGLYNQASQLSATRVANGGAAGLPHVAEQVSVQLHKAVVDGQRELVINLKPAELGKIEIKLEITAENKVTGTISAENQAALNLLQKDSAGLHRALQEAGLQTDSSSLQFSLKEENGNSQFAHQNKTTRDETFHLVREETNSDLIGEDLTASLDVQYLVPGRVNLRV